MRFVLFVEGHTEAMAIPHFLKRWLDGRLSKPVGIRPVRFDGWPHYVREIARKVPLHVGDADVIAVIGLLDLYGPTFYPPEKVSASDRYNWAKAHLEAKVDHRQFKQHFAVHEVEAWLLASPDGLPREVANGLQGRVTNPESVNFDQPPSKLIGRLYREKLRKRYLKAVYGKDLFRSLSPDVAYQKCPYLKMLLDDMLGLARTAGL